MKVSDVWRGQNDGSRAPLWGAFRIGATYVLMVSLAAALMVFSDPVVESWVRGPSNAPWGRLLMGGAFVLGSAAVIASLAYRELRKRWAWEVRQRSLIEQSLAGISVVQGGGFRFVNARFAEMFGYDADELVDSSLRVIDVIDPDERETVAENLRRRLQAEVDDVRYRYTGLTKAGERIRVDVHGRRIEWEGRPAVMSLHLDVTEEERLREQARRSQRLEALGELTGAVAHDFNNLLTTIIAPLDLCEAEISPDHPMWTELQEAKAGAKRAVSLTRQLLAFSRRRIYRSRPIDMTELIRVAEPMLSRLVPSGVRVDLDLPTEAVPVELDPSHFEQVLLNLVTNAADAVGSRGQIWIRAYRAQATDGSPGDVVVEVADDGKGMDEATCVKIFEPFYTTREHGTGLGLSTAHGIVTQADGTLSVDSTPGKGTTFTIRLPATDEEPEQLRPEGTDRGDKPKSAPTSATGRSILVVDDEDSVRQVTARVLVRHGMKARMAATAEAALSLVRGQADGFDILLTDVGLPDMNGVELAARIREIHPRTLVLYMSGHSDEGVLRRLARERSSGFVEKPFTVESLLEAVRTAVDEDGPGSATAHTSA